MITRLIGWLLVWVAVAAVGAELVASLDAGSWRSLSLYRHWFLVDNASLTGFAALLQRQGQWVWESTALIVLRPPLWSIAVVLSGLAFWRAGRRPRRKMFR